MGNICGTQEEVRQIETFVVYNMAVCQIESLVVHKEVY